MLHRRGKSPDVSGIHAAELVVRYGTTADWMSRLAESRDRMSRLSEQLPGNWGGRRIMIRTWGCWERAEERTGRWNLFGVRRSSRVDWVSDTDHGRRTRRRGMSLPPVQCRERRSLAGRVERFIFHSIALSFDDECLPVMHPPIDQGRCQSVVD